jgi:hypothetical protein
MEEAMTDNINRNNPEHGIFSQIREGMQVYDREDNEVGKVADIRFGEASEADLQQGLGPASADQPETGRREPFLGYLSRGLAGTPEDEAEAEHIRARMLRSGYIRIDTKGLFTSDRYALSEQIDSVEGERVRLNVHYDDLARRGD